ncbi:MAG: diguanylate cyclase [bacterium]
MKNKMKFILIIILFIIYTPIWAANNFLQSDAILNLQNINFSKEVISLDGEWEFYWQELLEPDDFHNSQKISSIVEVPAAWNAYHIDGETINSMGYATYRIIIEFDKNPKIKGLKIPRVFTSYKMWVNGELIASAGNIANSHENASPRYQPQLAFFQPEEYTEIIVQVSNFSHRSGGILESIILGSEENILNLRTKALAYDLFLFGALLIMGIYHLIIYIYRKKEHSILYFAIFCLLVSIRTIIVGEIFFIHLFPEFNWELAHNIQTLSYYLGVLFLFMFFKSLYPNAISDISVKLITIIVSLFTLLVLLTPARIFTYFNPLFQIFNIITIIYLFFSLFNVLKFKVIKEKDTSSLFIIIGVIILIISIVHDMFFLSILMSDYGFLRSFIKTGNLSSIGLLVFILANSLALSINYSRAFQRNEELITISRTDSLTNLWNRRYFEDVLKKEWELALNSQSSLSLLFMDVDNFKAYNDFYGHKAGDKCLSKISQCLKQSIRKTGDIVARIGGEEFVILLPETDITQALKKAENIRKNIEDLSIPAAENIAEDFVTISIGAASIIPDEKTTPADLILAADKAMYLAKQSGKNIVKSR